MKFSPSNDDAALSGLDRRSAFRTALAGAGAVAAPNLLRADEARPVRANRFAEPGRELPLVSDADVIVCGAGPAGVAAAITAARGGARVRLFEWRGCVGGVWTAGLLGYLLDFNKPGFARELAHKLDERGIRRGKSKGSITYEPEGMKLLLEDLLVEAGVKFQL